MGSEMCIRDSYSSVLSDEELMRSTNFYKKNDQSNYILRRGVLRHILSHYIQSHPHEVVFNADAYGRPHLVNTPYIDFNVSHSKSMLLLGVVKDSRIGIDIEYKESSCVSYDVFKQFSTIVEQSEFLSLTSQARIDTFFRTWVVKEAVVKAIGMGLFLNPKCIQLKTNFPNKPQAIIEFNPSHFLPRNLNISYATAGNGYAYSIVSFKNDKYLWRKYELLVQRDPIICVWR